MQPYDRIMSTVRYERPDRPAIDYAATPEAHAALKKHLRIEDDESLLRRLGVDIRHVAGRFVGPKDMTGAALEQGFTVCAGHGLNYGNVAPVARIKGMYELNIGHSIVSRAVFAGMREAVMQMRELVA